MRKPYVAALAVGFTLLALWLLLQPAWKKAHEQSATATATQAEASWQSRRAKAYLQAFENSQVAERQLREFIAVERSHWPPSEKVSNALDAMVSELKMYDACATDERDGKPLKEKFAGDELMYRVHDCAHKHAMESIDRFGEARAAGDQQGIGDAMKKIGAPLHDFIGSLREPHDIAAM